MNIAVISDLHLGWGDTVDSFGHDDHEFLRFLTFLERNFERIVLLGDIWETLTGRSPGHAEYVMRQAQAAHHEIAARFRRPQYSYVLGNHDLIAGRAEGAAEDLALEADGVRLLFTHGHQQDALLKTARSVAEFGVWLGGWIKRFGLSALYRFFQRIDERRSGATQAQADESFQQWALEFARHRQADVVITGHTHHAGRVERAGQLFLNSGSCSEGQFSFLSLDTRAGSYAVHQAW